MSSDTVSERPPNPGVPIHRVGTWVAIGGALGALVRLAFAELLPPWGGSGIPWATLLANMIACLLLGFLLALFRRKSISPELRQLGTAGFCGGLSTFGTFTWESLILLERGSPYLAAIYSAGSVVLGMLAVVAGIALTGTLLDPSARDSPRQ